MFLAFKNGVKTIQTAGYNGAPTVLSKNSDFYGIPRLKSNATFERLSTQIWPKKNERRMTVQLSYVIVYIKTWQWGIFYGFRISPCFIFDSNSGWKKEGVGADLWISCVLVTNLSRRISSFLPSSHLKRGEIEEAINSKSLHFSQLVWPTESATLVP